jgi:PHD/YefM family antitoxin component YafN of YafNO toxin-antitoxin module
MQTVNATEVRNHFSYYIDTVVRERPIAVKRNRCNCQVKINKKR